MPHTDGAHIGKRGGCYDSALVCSFSIGLRRGGMLTGKTNDGGPARGSRRTCVCARLRVHVYVTRGLGAADVTACGVCAAVLLGAAVWMRLETTPQLQ